jgi:hypothetical protein
MGHPTLQCGSVGFSRWPSLAVVLGFALGACMGSNGDDAPSGATNRDAGEGVDSSGGTGAGGVGSVDARTQDSETGGEDAGTGTRDSGTGRGDSGAGDEGGASPCTVTDTAAMCVSAPILTITNGADARRIYWNAPPGEPAPSGFAVVILFQGSVYGPSMTWGMPLAKATTPFGGYYQVALVARLLESRFIVVQPEAQGGLFWNTNNGSNYDTSPDSVFIPQLLGEIEKGTFGKADRTRLYAAGISSGGYMTSRMAVSYAGRFRALAIQSGSYATCLGALCSVPTVLPTDHAPTLFLHGGADTTVPIATAQDYYRKLQAQGIEAKFIEDPTASHQWLDTAPEEVTRWFLAH